MMGFGLLLLNCECWVLDRISRWIDAKPRPQRGTSRPARLLVRPGVRRLRDSRGSAEVSIRRGANMSRIQRILLCVAILSTAWRPRPPWSGSARPIGPPSARPLATIPLRARRLGRRRPAGHSRHHRAIRDDRIPQPGLREPQASRATAPPLDQLLVHRQEPAPHPGDLPAVRRLDQDRVADARARDPRRPTRRRPGSRGWVIAR